jgi:predicted  nucleic acid-binding Zn-ribbon protein
MIHDELHRLERLAFQVSKKIELLEAEKSALQDELTYAQSRLKEKDEALDHFKNQIKISKIVNNIPVENMESAELRARIDNYIKEIDKIITYLSE